MLALFLGQLSPGEFAAQGLRLTQPSGAYELERDQESGYPSAWANEKWPGHDHKDIKEFVQRFVDKSTGAMRNEKEVDEELGAEEEKKIDEWRNANRLQFRDWMVNDWSGEKYITTHRCFGHPCKSDLEKNGGFLVQLDSDLDLDKAQPRGHYESERDILNGYPALDSSTKETHEFVREYIDPATGGHKLQEEVDADREAKLEKELRKTYEKPAF